MEQAITGLVVAVVVRGILVEVEEEMVVTVEAVAEAMPVPVL
tara:strand:+ start:352 stop:477 length:126 start_codon:yes stop_codon:yes gene_type:complete